MIISHKYKFIFIKPRKVGGTSIEVALSKYCGKKDIITPITTYSHKCDSFEYKQSSRNYKSKGFYNHITPTEVKQKIQKEQWDKYYKFTVVRNPWDQIVSTYYWQIFNTKSRIFTILDIFRPVTILYFIIEMVNNIYIMSFKRFLVSYLNNISIHNTKYYFDKNKKLICDYYIKYENLEEDYRKICAKLNIPYEKLPLLKDKTRKKNKHYSKYYNNKMRDSVRKKFKQEIVFFNYNF